MILNTAIALGRRSICSMAAVLLATAVSLPAGAQTEVKIGYTGPLSGGGALYGKNVSSGIEMAIKEINESGFEVAGKRVRFELVALDDKYVPAESVLNARRLVQQHNVPAVFIPHTGGIYALQAFNEQEKFLVMAYSSVPKVTEVGNRLTVRIPPSFAAYIEPFVASRMQRFGKKLGMLPGDHEYAKAWTELFAAGWQKAGGTITATNPMSYNKSADFYSGVSRVLATNPDVLFVGGPSEPTALVVKQARELGFKGGFVLMDQSKMDEMTKVLGSLEPLEGAIGILPVALDPRPGAKAFTAAFRKAFSADREPTQESSYDYALMHALAQAMKLAGSTTDTAAIRAKLPEALAKLTPERNSGGFTGIDAQGGALLEPMLGLVEGGRIKPIALSRP